MGGIAVDKDGAHAEAAAKLDVGPGVADHDAGFRGDVRRVCPGLLEEPGERLPAVASGFVVGAEVEGVDVGAVGLEFALELVVDGADGGCVVEAEGDAALVGDDDDAEAGLVEAGDGLGNAGEQVEVRPGGDVAPFRQLLVEDSVAV